MGRTWSGPQPAYRHSSDRSPPNSASGHSIHAHPHALQCTSALGLGSHPLSKELGPAGYPGQHHQPGPSGTELRLGDHGVAQTVAQAAGTDPAEGAAQAAAGAVTGRFTRPAEIADLVLMLASDRTGSVTGSDFAIDGGLVQAL